MRATGMSLWRGALGMACLAGTCAGAEISIGIDPAHRTAWTENAGWANFAPTNGGITVHYYEGAGGYLAGYAWGENIGWITLGATAGGPYNNNSSTDWGVNLAANGSLSGYAWGQNVGWIKFDPTYGGVTVNTTNGQFNATAWGENIGWVKFQGTAPAYTVRTLAFDAQPQGTPNWWLTHYNVAEDFDKGDGVLAWKKYVMDTDPNVAGDYLRITTISNAPPATKMTFTPVSQRRHYTLSRRDELTAGNWRNVDGQAGIAGVGEGQTLQDTNLATRAFYRVNVTVMP